MPVRAVAVRSFGGLPELMELPDPSPGPGELLVRLESAGINPFDWKIADGILKDRRPHVFPLVLGVDGAGTIEATGPGVRRFRAAERIFGQYLHDPVGRGTYAERVVVPESNALARIPEGLAGGAAAALPTAGMAALDALDRLELSPGRSLVIVGASGGIGSYAVPLAAKAGIRVIAVARSASHARLRSLGAERAVDIAGASPLDEVRALYPQGVDGLMDVASDRAGFARWAEAVRAGGSAASTVYAATPHPKVRTINVDLQPSAALLERLARAVTEGSVKPPVERTIRLAEAPAVVAEGRAGRLVGKTVIDLSRLG